MTTIIKDTEMIFENTETMNAFMNRVYSNSIQKNNELKKTSENLKKIKSLNVNGKFIKVSR